MGIDAAAARQVVVFDLAGEPYAVDIRRVREIIRYTRPRSVAGASASIRGVINLRGVIVPVADLKARLGVPPGLDEARAKIVLVETGDGVAGMIVDDVAAVQTLTDDLVDEVPATAGCAAFLDGVARVGDRLLVLLDPDALFAGEFGDDLAEAA
jgi:purine-binding chemotaxis protein CheW